MARRLPQRGLLLYRSVVIELLDLEGRVVGREPFFGTDDEVRATAADLLVTSGTSVFGVQVRQARPR